jgi:hypothetical protein
LRHNLLLVGLALAIPLGSLNHVQAQALKVKKADDKIRPADQDRGSNVHKMTIQNGQTRTVQYFSNTYSPSEESALKELSRAENEASYVDDLLALRQQYMNTERALESRRRQVQLALYGKSIETNTSAQNKVTGYSPYMPADAVGLSTPAFNGFGGNVTSPFANAGASNLLRRSQAGSVAASIALAAGVGSGTSPFGFGTGFGGFGGFGFGSPFGIGGNPGAFGLGFGTNPYGPYGLGVNPGDVDSYSLKTDTKITHSLANGIGDEGKFKTAMVAQMASQATPEYASQAASRLTSALADASSILTKGPEVGTPVVREIPPPDKNRVVLHMHNGKRIDGYLLKEDAEWMVIWTPKADVRVRVANVDQIDTLAK